METIVPHAAAVMYPGRPDGEEAVRKEFCSATVIVTGGRGPSGTMT